jgi:hypothetical protein
VCHQQEDLLFIAVVPSGLMPQLLFDITGQSGMQVRLACVQVARVFPRKTSGGGVRGTGGWEFRNCPPESTSKLSGLIPGVCARTEPGAFLLRPTG